MNEPEPAEAYVANEIRKGDRRAIAHAMTLIERGESRGQHVLAELARELGRAHRVGITGPPGSGKSTLVSALTRRLVDAGKRVGIVAVDPTSRITGGALLGDRIRMDAVAAADRVFIRSMASRGAFGGLAPTSQSLADLLDAGRFDPVLIETVGVGQSEVEIAHAADTTVVVLAPGSGDGVQALKAGLAEVADVVVLNKSDLDGAELAAGTIESALALRGTSPAGWTVPVVRSSALHDDGIEEVIDGLAQHRAHLAEDDRLDRRRRRNLRRRILLAAQHLVSRDLLDRIPAADWERLLDEVIAGHETADQVASRLVSGLALTPQPTND